MRSICVLIGIVLGAATLEPSRRTCATATVTPTPGSVTNVPPPANCSTDACNCSKYDISADRPWGIFQGGVCLPWTGNFSMFIPCTALTHTSKSSSHPDYRPTNCGTNTTWEINAYTYAGLSNRDPIVHTPVTGVVGGVWVHYGYEGLSYAANMVIAHDLSYTITPVLVPCKTWVLTKGSGGTDTYNLGVCRLNISAPTANHQGAREGLQVLKSSTDSYFKVQTGLTAESNNWLALVEQAAKTRNFQCIVCMGPRPLLRVVPAAVCSDHVILLMNSSTFDRSTVKNCTGSTSVPEYDEYFPHVPPEPRPPLFYTDVALGNLTCVNFTGERRSRHIPSLPRTHCAIVVQANITFRPRPRADLWWWCGKRQLYDLLPESTSLTCALVSLILPITVVPVTTEQLLASLLQAEQRTEQHFSGLHIVKRSASGWKGDSDPTYIDAIGVPRGVPDEYKLADQVAAGFENIPLIAALFPITPNKNVDRINYIHYNVQKLGNYTEAGFEAIHEQLSATSLMAFQNRIALDMLLAENGGVCSMFPNGQCCSFIPNNTQSGGKLTKVLEGLRTFNKRLKEQSGIDNPWDRWFDHFGKYKGLVQSILLSIAVFAALLTMCGCCCIPCIRALFQRLIDRAITPMNAMLSEQVHLLVLNPDDDLPDDDLR